MIYGGLYNDNDFECLGLLPQMVRLSGIRRKSLAIDVNNFGLSVNHFIPYLELVLGDLDIELLTLRLAFGETMAEVIFADDYFCSPRGSLVKKLGNSGVWKKKGKWRAIGIPIVMAWEYN